MHKNGLLDYKLGDEKFGDSTYGAEALAHGYYGLGIGCPGMCVRKLENGKYEQTQACIGVWQTPEYAGIFYREFAAFGQDPVYKAAIETTGSGDSIINSIKNSDGTYSETKRDQFIEDHNLANAPLFKDIRMCRFKRPWIMFSMVINAKNMVNFNWDQSNPYTGASELIMGVTQDMLDNGICREGDHLLRQNMEIDGQAQLDAIVSAVKANLPQGRFYLSVKKDFVNATFTGLLENKKWEVVLVQCGPSPPPEHPAFAAAVPVRCVMINGNTNNGNVKEYLEAL